MSSTSFFSWLIPYQQSNLLAGRYLNMRRKGPKERKLNRFLIVIGEFMAKILAPRNPINNQDR